MLLVFILLFLLFLFVLTIFFFTKVKFYIVIKGNKSKVRIGFSVFGIQFLKYNVSKRKERRKSKKRNDLKKNNRKNEKKKIIGKSDVFYIIKRLSEKQGIYIEKLYSRINVSAGEAVTTSILVATVSNIISFFLKIANVRINRKFFKYSVIPIYEDKKIFDVYLDSIITIKLVHITYIVFTKWRRDRHGRKTSN